MTQHTKVAADLFMSATATCDAKLVQDGPTVVIHIGDENGNRTLGIFIDAAETARLLIKVATRALALYPTDPNDWLCVCGQDSHYGGDLAVPYLGIGHHQYQASANARPEPAAAPDYDGPPDRGEDDGPVRTETSPSYRASMRDAGRGGLLR